MKHIKKFNTDKEENTSENLFNYPKKTGDSLMDFLTSVNTKFEKFIQTVKSDSIKECKESGKKKSYNDEAIEAFKKMYYTKALQGIRQKINEELKDIEKVHEIFNLGNNDISMDMHRLNLIDRNDKIDYIIKNQKENVLSKSELIKLSNSELKEVYTKLKDSISNK